MAEQQAAHPVLRLSATIRRVIYTTETIESLDINFTPSTLEKFVGALGKHLAIPVA